MYKKLLSQTLIYGLSNVLVRVFPFILTPILVRTFGPFKYSIYADFYSAAGILSVLLTHGMETTFFRFFQKFKDQGDRQNTVYFTSFTSVCMVSLLFLLLGIISREPLASAFKHPDEVIFLVWFLFILAADAISAVPFAKLRIQNRSLYFASLKILNSVIMFFSTVILIFWIPKLIEHDGIGAAFFSKIYNFNYGIGYAFAANLFASIITFLALLPTMLDGKYTFDYTLWKKMLSYAWPITIAGLAGIINETMDRQFIKYLLPKGIAEVQMGIYSAVYKIATFITLFKTAYLLGVEPFFFSHADNKNSGKTYATLMKYYAIFSAVILLFLTANLDWIGRLYIRNTDYWSGFQVVPILLIGSTFLGIYLNLSIWYKLSDNTHYGAIISGIGACITVALNFIGLKYTDLGYWVCAIATFVSYLTMMLISYFWGQREYPIPYNYKKLIFYIGGSSLLSLIAYYCSNHIAIRIGVGNILFIIFIYLTLKIEYKDIQIFKEKILQLKKGKKN
ncbi:Membrane protein involved in the export of O-antigen and teichoic acid [Apibacter mensalis]|uniref:Membrane protein involved in the export of O-antigen and teichoic acid n=1 Tax=Apibacter mensalis TaxID=1586267 RepID=A0A0X3AQB0_9FLAO|nr:oligosaccharide flippase family protein [Apibacter mensalis]CVK16235.1 Membrane protein involved in the export of O-antigen and teichoic acid [Apibacter mensalis]